MATTVEFVDEHLSEAIITSTVKWPWPLKTTSTYRYRGSGTVWHHYPSGGRCATPTESWLCDVWTAAKWEREDARRKWK